MVNAARMLSATILAVAALSTTSAWAQAVGGAEGAKPVTGDPGLSSMVVIERPEFRVLRDYAEPGATRRMHSHDCTYQVLMLVTGQLQLTIEGESPITVTPGQAVYLKGNAKHTFINTANVTATLVEVFGKAPPAAGDRSSAPPMPLLELLATAPPHAPALLPRPE